MAERRHARDTTSLVLGLLLLAGGVLFLVGDTTDRTIDGRWVGPVVLIAIGVLGLLSAVGSTRRGNTDAAPVVEPHPTSQPPTAQE